MGSAKGCTSWCTRISHLQCSVLSLEVSSKGRRFVIDLHFKAFLGRDILQDDAVQRRDERGQLSVPDCSLYTGHGAVRFEHVQ
ncbi:unnamed protein product [Calypogeia fissa]